MIALPVSDYLDFARERAAAARHVVDTHVTCAYTGLCRACGRPGPCPDQLAARLDLAHAAATTAAPAATTAAVRLAAGAVDELRAACLTAEGANDRMAGQLDGSAHPLPAWARTRWDAALRDAWQALALIRSGLAEARQLDGADPASVDGVLDELRTARHDAQQAVTGLDRLRRRLIAAVDLLRHGDASPRARAAAGRWRAAITRLDLASARLAIGIQALDRYADRLSGAASETGATDTGRGGTDGGTTPTHGRTPPVWRAPAGSAAEVAVGARTAAAVLLTYHPWGGWRGFLARVRRQRHVWREQRAQGRQTWAWQAREWRAWER